MNILYGKEGLEQGSVVLCISIGKDKTGEYFDFFADRGEYIFCFKNRNGE